MSIKLPFTKSKPNALQVEINSLLETMGDMTPTNPAYDTYSEQVVKLYKLQEVDSKKHVSPDALVGAVASLGGIILILAYEHGHVLTSKALSFVKKSI